MIERLKRGRLVPVAGGVSPRPRDRSAASPALAALAGLAGCGSNTTPAGDLIHGHELTLYASLPLQGASGAARRGRRSAARGSRSRRRAATVGDLRSACKVLDDTAPPRGEWDPGQTSIDARTRRRRSERRRATSATSTPGASAVSIPLLARAGIPQVSPAAPRSG